MSRRGKIMVVGAIIMAIGIIIIIVGYKQYSTIGGAREVYKDAGEIITLGTPPGAVVTTIGILIWAIGMFISIYGFGPMEENRKLQETK
jgi:hypothetical protein